MSTRTEHELSYLNDEQRLKAVDTVMAGCTHLWSKGKLQRDKLTPVLDVFMNLANEDPHFLAHFTSYAVTKLDSKDLKVVSVFANSLNDADGTPFSPGSKYKKPNLRLISQAAVQDKSFDPKLVERLIEIANIKQALGGKHGEGTHFSRSLKTAIRKYLRFREANPKAIEGIKKVGFGRRFQNLYRSVRIAPSDLSASILGWAQKDGRKIDKKSFFDFTGMSDKDIAEKIRADKLSPTGVLGALPAKVSPVIAVAILEQASGNQAVILRELFDSQGLLKNKEVMALFEKKIKTATTALDRVERMNTDIDEDVKNALKSAKADKRKADVGDIGKVFIHIDASPSMERALEIAGDSGTTIAEAINNPGENFHWGLFRDASQSEVLELPDTFEKDAFKQILYGKRCGGMTDVLGLYEHARKQGCDIDIIISDQGHNQGDIATRIRSYDQRGIARPKAVVIVHIPNDDYNAGERGDLKRAFESINIPAVEIEVEGLKESALVSQAIRTALVGSKAILDDIMSTKLLTLPEWWESV